MNPTELLKVTHLAERLKDAPRHAYTTGGRRESVAEHSFRIALMAYFLKDEFPDVDMEKLLVMCLIHDLGECFTGDIPTFKKTAADEAVEKQKLYAWVESLPAPYDSELLSLYEEMIERKTPEAKLFKVLDGLEAVIQHNESDISTWEPNEFELNLHYAEDRCAYSPYLVELRKVIREETEAKIGSAPHPTP